MHLTKSYRINIEAVLKLIILLGFALFFYLTIESGKALLYIHPRIVPYMNFGIVAMILISLFIVRDIFKPKRKVSITPYLFFLIPLIMAFALPAKSMDSTSMAFGKIKITQQSRNAMQNNDSNEIITQYSDAESDIAASDNDTSNSDSNNKTLSSNAADDDTANSKSSSDNTLSSIDNISSPDSVSNEQANSDELGKPLKMQNNTIVMDDDNFTLWMDEIYLNMEKYEGKKIQLIGLVFKNKEFKLNEFVPARLTMSCCSADLQPIGFLCRYNNASELKQDSWVKVSGIIKSADYNGDKMPIIVAEKVEKAEKPKNEYVYPNY